MHNEEKKDTEKELLLEKWLVAKKEKKLAEKTKFIPRSSEEILCPDEEEIDIKNNYDTIEIRNINLKKKQIQDINMENINESEELSEEELLKAEEEARRLVEEEVRRAEEEFQRQVEEEILRAEEKNRIVTNLKQEKIAEP
ncbi:MAG: hypothetical protein ABRQ39_10885, partial [Candidatus Eremiobacterota bacterium]